MIGDVAEKMLGYVEKGKTFMTGKTMSVPARRYTDPVQFKAEMELIFKHVPLMLALTCEMKNPGDFKAMDVIGLPVLINRDKKGQVRAFLNVCAHRGAPVASEGYGNCPLFVCKYHGWTYGQDGRLMGVSEASKFGNIDKSAKSLRELQCEEHHGLIFVCLTPGLQLDLDAYYGKMLDDYEVLNFKDWHYLGSKEIERANWKIAFDGYLEGYHFSSLHADTIYLRTPSNVMHYGGFGPNQRIGFPHHANTKLREIPRDQWSEQENNGVRFRPALLPQRVGVHRARNYPDGAAIPRADARQEPLRIELYAPRSTQGYRGTSEHRGIDDLFPRRHLQ